jgi:hypothetical protein
MSGTCPSGERLKDAPLGQALAFLANTWLGYKNALAYFVFWMFFKYFSKYEWSYVITSFSIAWAGFVCQVLQESVTKVMAFILTNLVTPKISSSQAWVSSTNRPQILVETLLPFSHSVWPGACTIKLITVIIYGFSHSTRVFVCPWQAFPA